MKNWIIIYVFICISIQAVGQKSVYFIIDTLDYPSEFNMLDYDSRYIRDGTFVDEKLHCNTHYNDLLFIDHESNYRLNEFRHLRPGFYDICFEFILKDKTDTIVFPLDNKGGLLFLINSWKCDTINIPRYRILKNDIADSIFTYISYEKLLQDGSEKFINQKESWTKRKGIDKCHLDTIQLLINGIKTEVLPIIHTKIESSRFHGYKYSRYTLFHKLLGIKQVRFGGVMIEHIKVANSFIDIKTLCGEKQAHSP
jgi:hypothetical protein